MKVVKVLNNNVLIAEDQEGLEHILIGSGVSFGAKPDDAVSMHKVERMFSQHEPEAKELFTLVAEIPIECLQITNEIVEYAEHRLNTKLNRSIYIALTDHINYLQVRMKEGLVLKNPMKWEIQRFYPDEYEIGLKSLDLIETYFGMKPIKDEAASIAMHIVNVGTSIPMGESIKSVEMMNDIMRIIQFSANITEHKNGLNYQRLLTHIKFYIDRIMSNQQNNGENLLHAMVIESYPDAYRITQKVDAYINRKMGFSLSKDEVTYLTVHLHRVMEKE